MLLSINKNASILKQVLRKKEMETVRLSGTHHVWQDSSRLPQIFIYNLTLAVSQFAVPTQDRSGFWPVPTSILRTCNNYCGFLARECGLPPWGARGRTSLGAVMLLAFPFTKWERHTERWCVAWWLPLFKCRVTLDKPQIATEQGPAVPSRQTLEEWQKDVWDARGSKGWFCPCQPPPPEGGGNRHSTETGRASDGHMERQEFHLWV